MLLLVVITRVEGVDLGKFLFTRLEKFLLKLGIVPLDRVLVCDCKKVKGSKISEGPSRLDGKWTGAREEGQGEDGWVKGWTAWNVQNIKQCPAVSCSHQQMEESYSQTDVWPLPDPQPISTSFQLPSSFKMNEHHFAKPILSIQLL